MLLKLILILSFVSLPAFSQKRLATKLRKLAAHFTLDTSALQNIKDIENRRLSQQPELLNYLSHPSQKVVFSSLTALGRIGEPFGFDEISRLLNQKNAEKQKKSAFALGLIGGETSLKLLEQHYQMQRPIDVLQSYLLGIGQVGSEKSLPYLTQILQNETNLRKITSACFAVGYVLRTAPENIEIPSSLLEKLLSFAISNSPAAEACAFAASRFKGEIKMTAVETFIGFVEKMPSEQARFFIVRVMGKIKNPLVANWLATEYKKSLPSLFKVELIKASKNYPNEESVLQLLRAAIETNDIPQIIVALETIQAMKKSVVFSQLVSDLVTKTKSQWVKEMAIKTLAKTDPSAAKPLILSIFKNNPDAALLGAALHAFTYSASSDELDKLMPGLTKAPVPAVIDWLSAIQEVPDEKVSENFKQELKKVFERKDAGLTSVLAEVVQAHLWKDFSQNLVQAYTYFPESTETEAKVSILNALAALNDLTTLPTIETALKDPEKSVIASAVAAIKTLTGKDLSSQIPSNSKVTASTPPYSEWSHSPNQRVVLKTTKGEIVFKMLPDAPLTAYEFLKLVRAQFYDRKTFHRVVPGFVAQGGDPRGDGYGGPGFFLREEISTKSHLVGTVGMATAGKDTGGCQFFINLFNNYHLDGRYTVFAEVTHGMPVAQKLEVGDIIISARVK